jgi:hypothetical protein
MTDIPAESHATNQVEVIGWAQIVAMNTQIGGQTFYILLHKQQL